MLFTLLASLIDVRNRIVRSCCHAVQIASQLVAVHRTIGGGRLRLLCAVLSCLTLSEEVQQRRFRLHIPRLQLMLSSIDIE